MDLLQGALSPEMVNEIGSTIGSNNPEQTHAAANDVFSTLLGGLAKNASTPEGAQNLNNALERDHDGSILDGILGAVGGQGGGGMMGNILGSVLGGGGQQSGGGGGLGDLLGSVLGGGQQSGGGGGMLGSILGSVLGGGQSKATNGAGILGHILGDRQDAAAQAVSQRSGLDMGSVLKLLPILAPILMQVLGKVKNTNGLGAGDLAGVLGGAAQQHSQQSGIGGMLSGILDRDGDGSVMDDLLGMAGNAMMNRR